MVTIRFAEPNDHEQMQEMLKATLGDPHGRRNPIYWKWKHLDNPFGPSVVLLAFINGELAGVRAMMPWEFRLKNDTIRAWRAVDTATAPNHQRSGVFSKLTSAMVDHLAGLGPALIFNTPNPVSAKGYFKLGWLPAGNSDSLVRPIFSGLLMNRFKKYRPQDGSELTLPTPQAIYESAQLLNNQLITNWNPERISWRYAQVPGLKYQSLQTENGFVIYRITKRNFLNELRIVELFPVRPELKSDILELINLKQPDIVTVLNDGAGVIQKYLPSGFISVRPWSPPIVCRPLNDSNLTDIFRNENRRYFSAGTLELF